MENNATGSDYQVIRFHRGRPTSTSERENSDSRDLDHDQTKRANTEGSPTQKGNQKERDKSLEDMEK